MLDVIKKDKIANLTREIKRVRKLASDGLVQAIKNNDHTYNNDTYHKLITANAVKLHKLGVEYDDTTIDVEAFKAMDSKGRGAYIKQKRAAAYINSDAVAAYPFSKFDSAKYEKLKHAVKYLATTYKVKAEDMLEPWELLTYKNLTAHVQ